MNSSSMIMLFIYYDDYMDSFLKVVSGLQLLEEKLLAIFCTLQSDVHNS